MLQAACRQVSCRVGGRCPIIDDIYLPHMTCTSTLEYIAYGTNNKNGDLCLSACGYEKGKRKVIEALAPNSTVLRTAYK